jgi:flagellar secretion chaperone FliS
VTYDPTAAYRTAQVTTSSPAAQIVLLYEGAIRFTMQSIVRLEQRDLEGSHQSSLRAQAIISALRESLDLSAGDVATRLDLLYDFMHRQLVAANIAKNPAPAREVVELLRDLLMAWRSIASPSGDIAAAAPTLASLPVLRASISGVA